MGLNSRERCIAMFVGCLVSTSALAQNSAIETTIELLSYQPRAVDAAQFKETACPSQAPQLNKVSPGKTAQVVLYPDGTSDFKADGEIGSFRLAPRWGEEYDNLQGRITVKGLVVCLSTLTPNTIYSIRRLSNEPTLQDHKNSAVREALNKSALFELQVWGTFKQAPGDAQKSAEHFAEGLKANKSIRAWLVGATYSTNKNPLRSWLASAHRSTVAVKERQTFERALPDAELTEQEWKLLLHGVDSQPPAIAATIDALLPPQFELVQALARHYSTVVVQPLFIGTLPATSNVLALSSRYDLQTKDIAGGTSLLAVYGHNLKTPTAAMGTGDKLAALPPQDIATTLSPVVQSIAGGLNIARQFQLPSLLGDDFLPLIALQSTTQTKAHRELDLLVERLPASTGQLPARHAELSTDSKQVLASALKASSKLSLLGHTSSVLLLNDSGANKQYRFAVCRDVAACDEKTFDQSILSELRIRSTSHPYVSLGAEMTFDLPLHPSKVAYGGYQFVPISGGLGPNKLYELRPSQDAAQHFTFSALLIGYPLAKFDNPWARGVGVALEGGLFRGGQSAFLSQWGWRGIYEFPFARGLFLSAGFSWRSVSVPIGIAPGTIIAVAPSDSAPAFNGRVTWVPSFSMGLGVDLGVVGDAVKGVGDAFSGARAPPVNGIVATGG